MYRKIADTISEKEYQVLREYKKSDKVKRIAQNKLSEKELEILEARAKMIGKEEEKVEEAFLNSRDIFS